MLQRALPLETSVQSELAIRLLDNTDVNSCTPLVLLDYARKFASLCRDLHQSKPKRCAAPMWFAFEDNKTNRSVEVYILHSSIIIALDCSCFLHTRIQILMMQFEIPRKIEIIVSARLQPHISTIFAMPKRKRPPSVAGSCRVARTDNHPFWWDDDVEFLSSRLRETDDVNFSHCVPRVKAAKLRTKITSQKKCAATDLTRLLRVRIMPTEKQRHQFDKWFGIHRQVFNKTIDRLNAGIPGTPYDHRKAVLSMGGIFSDHHQSKCDLRQAASQAACSTFGSTKASLKANPLTAAA